jgi:hypothetical protein
MILLTSFGFFLLGVWTAAWRHEFRYAATQEALLLAVIAIAVTIVWHGRRLTTRRDPVRSVRISTGTWTGLAMQMIALTVAIGACLEVQEPLLEPPLDVATAALAAMLGALGVLVTAWASWIADTPKPPPQDQVRP